MACVPLTSLMNTIQFEFLQPRPPVILDEDTAHMVTSLYHNLCFLLAFLEELVKKAGIDEAAIKDLEAKIRDLAFLAEDEIESNLANIYMEAADKEMTLFQNLQQVGEDAEMMLFQNLRQVSEKTQNFIQNLPKVHTLPLDIVGSDHKSGSSQRFSKIEDRMVGRTSELHTIMDQLIGHPWKVISILGVGGIGKTTLAKRVYEDPLVISHFHLSAWTTVSQEVNLRQILCNLLWSIERGMNTDGSTDDLAHKLRQRLMGKRYLIVVDDVWETGVWDHLTRCFPKSHGSSVLVDLSAKRDCRLLYIRCQEYS
ncbi:probable disease resistance RPP8-like protein 4 isoform X5 [Ipomoea triloba]|uniref:probable disease resistance RPP8-like protein 4 isoform X5 n=1 Tax=Ipomoea triloba TaxID=35885 RepID=UPI00125CDF11|nr:probable disease resistance RPP8-like protein 4 isoform X5 [Ipomoea triloba]